MLENFHLAAIIKQDGQSYLRRIPLHQELQRTLGETWQEQSNTFVKDVQEIDFNAGYQPEKHEIFRLEDCDLPDWLKRQNSQCVSDVDAITNNDELFEHIAGLVAFALNDREEEVMLFQNFSRSHVIQPGRFLFLEKDTYETAQRPGLTLAGKLSAVYLSVDRNLLFRNFTTVNTFLPLADYYAEASEAEIRDVLRHDLLSAEDPDALAVGANQWFRQRFAMLRNSEVLDKYTAGNIRDRANGHDIKIRISEEGKIVFPTEKREAKRLLQFLNEEIFRGAITEALYETNSKRQADK